MLKNTFIVWASHKLNFIRGLTWCICGFAFGVQSLLLGVIFLALSLILNFFASRLELVSDRVKAHPEEKPVKSQNSASDAMQLYSQLLQQMQNITPSE